jgi:hypothetical protein
MFVKSFITNHVKISKWLLNFNILFHGMMPEDNTVLYYFF